MNTARRVAIGGADALGETIALSFAHLDTGFLPEEINLDLADAFYL